MRGHPGFRTLYAGRGGAVGHAHRIVAFLAALALAAPALLAAQADEDLGKATYDKWCAHCHGVDGAGEGEAAAYMLPRPRDFTTALYQIRTTASGQLPTDEDMMRIIDEGMPGTAMPGWSEWLSRNEREALVEYLKTFSRFFETEATPEPLEFSRPPRVSDEGLAEGRRLYEEIECWKCHGQAGRGDGSSAPTLEDDNDRPVRAVDLTQNWYFDGGGSTEDIYRRLRTGLDGTPMPSFSDLLESGFMTDEELWNLAQYVRSLSPEDRPRAREVVRAGLAEEGLPASVDDEAWAGVERFWIPLVGQVVLKPRWFNPRVSGVWAQALHDGEELVLRVSWTDPSRSPDPAWLEWQEKVLPLMQPEDGVPLEPAPRPDRLIVQFPTEVPEGMQRPYFLGGDDRDPVYHWRWSSDAPGAVEEVARGFGTGEPLATQIVDAEASWSDGEWRVLFRRPILTGADDDVRDRLQLETGRPVPVAFFAWDGDNGEEDARGAISSWYFVFLQEPTPGTVYATPLIAMMLTAGLGVFVVARAQRRERRSDHESEATSTNI